MKRNLSTVDLILFGGELLASTIQIYEQRAGDLTPEERIRLLDDMTTQAKARVRGASTVFREEAKARLEELNREEGD